MLPIFATNKYISDIFNHDIVPLNDGTTWNAIQNAL